MPFKTSAKVAGSPFLRSWASPGRSLGVTHADVAAPGVACPLLSRSPRSFPTSCGRLRPRIKNLLRGLILLSLRSLKGGTSYCRSERHRGAPSRQRSWPMQRGLARRTPRLERGCSSLLLQLGDDRLTLHVQDVKKFEITAPFQTGLRAHDFPVRIASETEKEVFRN